MASLAVESRRVLPLAALRGLNVRSDAKGALRLAMHLGLIAASGGLVFAAVGPVAAMLAMTLHGIVLVALFAPMHEGVHYTAFKHRRTNEIVAWLAGTVFFNNASLYRQFHYAHHKWCQDAARDPERALATPDSPGRYWLTVSGLPYWRARLTMLAAAARGDYSAMWYVGEHAQAGVTRSVRLQLALYAAVALGAVAVGSTAPLLYWLGPVLLGMPFLRAYLLAEHTGCSEDDNGLTNTRTTLTLWPVRLLMWNMPFHAEHHLYPSIPFHALPRAHALVRDRLAHLGPGYVAVNREIYADARQAV